MTGAGGIRLEDGDRRADAIRRAHRRWSITLGLVVVQGLLEAILAQEAILRRDRGWAENHASDNNSASRSIGWVGSRSSTSLRYAKGSPPSRLQLPTKLYSTAAVRPPRS